ncbi:MAG: hypothetical protein IKZ95_01950 [Lachnospiraceae bacterium]|nr:hypothetical protein [Lachnospiraceae bacterium]
MLADHAAIILFPDMLFLRYIGRLALPIFAFMVAEGVLHTRSKGKYFLRVFILAVICQVAYTAFDLICGTFTGIYLNTLFTLSFGILICYAWLSAVKDRKKVWQLILAVLLIVAVYVFCSLPVKEDGLYTTYAIKFCGFPIAYDYDFMGAMLPLTAMIIIRKPWRFVIFGVGLVLLSLSMLQTLPYQWFCLLALIPLWFYNGERGRWNLKYLFYIFYPLHLVVLEGILMLK